MLPNLLYDGFLYQLHPQGIRPVARVDVGNGHLSQKKIGCRKLKAELDSIQCRIKITLKSLDMLLARFSHDTFQGPAINNVTFVLGVVPVT